MEPLLVEAFRYNKWANLHLLGVCRDFTDEQLQMTAPGTYGTLAATFFHLVAAEQRYLRRLGGGEPVINERDEFPGMAALTEHATRSGDKLIAIAPHVSPDEVHESSTAQAGTVLLHSGVVVLQALHHGNDHRTHIGTILGHHGLSYGDMDVWAYGEATGGIVRVGAS